MANFKGIVYLSEEQYMQMYDAKTLDENTQYVTPDTQQGAGDAYTKAETDELLQSVENKIPTKTSELENDSNFVTDEDLANIQVSVPVRNFMEV